MPILTKGCVVQLSCSHNESYRSLHGSKFPFSLAKEQNKSVCLIGQQTHLKFIWRVNAICQGTWTAKQIVLKSEYEFSFGFRESIGGTDRGWIHIALLICFCTLFSTVNQHCSLPISFFPLLLGKGSLRPSCQLLMLLSPMCINFLISHQTWTSVQFESCD